MPARHLCARIQFHSTIGTRLSALDVAIGLDVDPINAAATATLIKAVPAVVTVTVSLYRAISTAGGIAWSEIDEHLMLRNLPDTLVAGKALDWEAPTGGYLLQASLSTGVEPAPGALE